MTTVKVKEPTVKVQTWSESLRLPCFVNAAETAGVLATVEHLRKPSIPFQSKHLPSLKRNIWYVLQRPVDRTRTGLVCLWPQQRCCIYISGDAVSAKRPTPRVALLRLRVDPQFFGSGSGSGLTVFAASLSATTRKLMIEDTVIWKGRPLVDEEPFSKRWALATQFLEHYCILDNRLLDGLDLEMARWQPLDALRPEGIWELQADEVGRRRLLWITNNAPHEQTSTSTISTPSTPSVTVPKLEPVIGPLVAIAKSEAGPEQWGLTSSNGVSLGKLLVRNLAASTALRSVKGNTTRVEVAWNMDFGKWEFRSLSTALASHSGNFESAK